MPLFDYACQDCGTQSEVLVRGGEEPSCPRCGSAKLIRQLAIVAAPSRGASAGDSGARPSGSCGAGCGCHPHG